ncbi:MAG: hypothetical protein PHR00_02465 [Patescibacteria group bacterium]|nr:hypothetical protein [Patescibacteria group bacterium]
MYPVRSKFSDQKFREKTTFRNKSAFIFKNRGTSQSDRPKNKIRSFAGRNTSKLIAQKILFISFFVALGALIWIFFYSDIFKIKIIDVSQNINISTEDVRGIVEDQMQDYKYLVLPQANLFVFDTAEFKEKAFEKYQLYSIDIKKNIFSQRVVIKLAEKDYNYIWREGNDFYYINNLGEIILTKTTGDNNLITIDNTTSSLRENKLIKIDQKYLSYIKELDAVLRKNNHNLGDRQFIYDGAISGLKIQLINGPQLFFNIDRSIDEQLNKLDNLRRVEFRDGTKLNNLNYIDLRFGDKIFYR